MPRNLKGHYDEIPHKNCVELSYTAIMGEESVFSL